jgi:anti-sigma regulatory factor (Ser/Thr protein kinase)
MYRQMEAAAPALLGLIAVAIVAAVVWSRRTSPPAAEPPVHSAAPTLQSALLPSAPPVIDGLRISWSYVPATDGDAAGGDFYDAFFLDDSSVAVVIGDADGRGLTAIVTMNTVRQAIRSAMIDGARPADALRRANRVLLRSDNPGIVTAIVGIIDPATLQFRYAVAGHPLPLLATADETCAPLPDEGSGIALGVVPHHVTSERVVSIPVDGMLALYTDGCVTSGADGTTGTDTLAEALVQARTLAPNKPAIAIDRAIFGERERGDDATIVTIAPEPLLAHLDVRLPAELTSAALARTALRRFLATTPLGERRSFDAVVAVGEAVANAIEHAYDRRPNQTFVLRARFESETCTVLVEDTGAWNDVEPLTTRGRGIAMMRELCDNLEIDRTPNGTSVALEFQVARNLADASLVLT